MQDQDPAFGSDKTLEECDWIYAQLPAKIRDEDRFLYGTKWFDYRTLHPVQATYLFAHAYDTAYREAYAKNVDHARAEHVKSIKGVDVLDFATKGIGSVTGFVKARQWADALGMPYIEFTRIAMTWAMRRTRAHLPRPCHLYNFDLLTAIQETWRDRQKGQVFVAENPMFRNEAYVGVPVQDAHHEWLLQQASLRSNPDHYLARVLYDDDVLLESKVEARFGRETLERARRAA